MHKHEGISNLKPKRSRIELRESLHIQNSCSLQSKLILLALYSQRARNSSELWATQSARTRKKGFFPHQEWSRIARLPFISLSSQDGAPTLPNRDGPTIHPVFIILWTHTHTLDNRTVKFSIHSFTSLPLFFIFSRKSLSSIVDRIQL